MDKQLCEAIIGAHKSHTAKTLAMRRLLVCIVKAHPNKQLVLEMLMTSMDDVAIREENDVRDLAYSEMQALLVDIQKPSPPRQE